MDDILGDRLGRKGTHHIQLIVVAEHGLKSLALQGSVADANTVLRFIGARQRAEHR